MKSKECERKEDLEVDESDERGMPILVTSDHESGMAWADVVPQKGNITSQSRELAIFCQC